MVLNVGYNEKRRIEITNRQKHVEFKELDGRVTEQEARAEAGNYNRGNYDNSYTGFYWDRGCATSRLYEEIRQTEKLLENLKFCLKVTKKRVWKRVK